MIVLGLMGRPDRPGCHDAAACLVIDGTVVGALGPAAISAAVAMLVFTLALPPLGSPRIRRG